MNTLLLVFFVPGFLAFAQDDVVHSSTLTFGVGGKPYSDNVYSPGEQKGGPAFTGNYEFRLSRYLALEAGTDILLPVSKYSGESIVLAGQSVGMYTGTCCALVVNERSSVTLLTYGFKGILPLAGNRLELFAGVGGAYGWNSELSGQLNSAFAQANVGGRLAIDRGRRFWLGTTLRGFASFGPGRQDWVPLTFNFGIRFGH